MSRSRELLLADLDACRWLTMRALADEAEERGDDVLAAGWRWLAEERYWPAGTLYVGEYYFWQAATNNGLRQEGRLRRVVLSRLVADIQAMVDGRREEADAAYQAAKGECVAEGHPWYDHYTFVVTIGHWELRLRRWRDWNVLDDWHSASLPVLLEATARVAGQWLAEKPQRKKRPAKEAAQ